MRAYLCMLLAGIVQCTRIKFWNNCGHEVHVMKTMKGHGSEEQAMLNPGETEMSEEMNGGEMSFTDGDHGANMAEFNINAWNSMDLYDLNVVGGFTTPMRISTDGVGGHTVHCRDHRCLEAYLFPNDALKTHGIATGGMFTLTFCP
ncbi:hypothetical protein PRIPAC_77748 [Pristionchus pacificus]|uniref:Uncharacterized protein n=1 Tax=Pristionchus pacificus TaxID=54126 RepID=A0A2A6CKW8_PRIPA|nr:hypothetical protein PRIPAC_77748 [Pristionchus pacificus]|eukprot:PDM78738.1 hypothetical protein PRIPAC_31317 [Pristionchus pacificus]